MDGESRRIEVQVWTGVGRQCASEGPQGGRAAGSASGGGASGRGSSRAGGQVGILTQDRLDAGERLGLSESQWDQKPTSASCWGIWAKVMPFMKTRPKRSRWAWRMVSPVRAGRLRDACA